MRYRVLGMQVSLLVRAGCVAVVLAAGSWCGTDASAQGPGLPGAGLPGARNTGVGMIGAGRPSVAAGGQGAPGQLNARVGGRGYSAHSIGQGGSLPSRRSSGAGMGMGMAGVPQTGQFRGQNMAQGMRNVSVPRVGGRR